MTTRDLGLLPLLLILMFPNTAAAGEAAGSAGGSDAWLAEVDLLVTPREREAFLGLGGDAERQAFIRRFWQVRDPHPATPVNELEERWAARRAESRERWGGATDDRSRLFMMQGEPSTAFTARCDAAAAPVEVWIYEPRFGVKARSVVAFVHDGAGAPARLWLPDPESPRLAPAAFEACENGRQLAEAARWIRLIGEESYRGLVERALAPPRPQPEDWVATFATSAAVPAGPPPDAPTFEADLAVDYPGRYRERTVMRGMVTVPLAALRPAAAPGSGPRELVLTGEVVGGRQVLDSFRYRFSLPRDAAAGVEVPLAFERHLRPGHYRLRVLLEDLLARVFFRGERELSVPRLGGEAMPPAEAAARPASLALDPVPGAAMTSGTAAVFAEAAASLSAPEPGLRLLRPAGGDLLTGTVRFEARVDQAPGVAGIESVAFLLEGRRVLARTRPPYAVELDLGASPRVHTLTALGLSRGGEVLATDELVVNGGAQRFAVRLLEPRPGAGYRRSLRARAEVEAPAGRAVERVELYLDEDLVATLYQPPFAQPIALARPGAASFVRAVAYLADGSAAEDTVFVNMPATAAGTEMDVRLVELYATVLDRAGRPVESLAGDRFQLLENGVRQPIRELEPAAGLPLACAVLIDNSFSMRGHLTATREAALGFLRQALDPRDRAAVITFNRQPRLAVGLTGDVAELERGLSGLVAEDKTSLYDSLLFGLNYLTGVRGQRAVLLLSDGQDQGSGFSFEQALEYARRTGVPVYAVGLALAKGERGEAAGKLARLAAETGGRSFFVGGTAELPAVYAEIERELRSQYRIAYQSTNTDPGGGFRAIELRVEGAGLEARTISGYYP